ncbi:uncharacterized protein LOC127749457 [Frankliniella occidentalis]|uniref:Uncharacterized protein LOC127749457 n=1 Tax=Frankliniella occidentalis TaxID=133901 RepID=A0A9C6WXY8_FRAOC|nr:uncharacterized protein LOC127749457 [Frankliniella occidentalis]
MSVRDRYLTKSKRKQMQAQEDDEGDEDEPPRKKGSVPATPNRAERKARTHPFSPILNVQPVPRETDRTSEAHRLHLVEHCSGKHRKMTPEEELKMRMDKTWHTRYSWM